MLNTPSTNTELCPQHLINSLISRLHTQKNPALTYLKSLLMDNRYTTATLLRQEQDTFEIAFFYEKSTAHDYAFYNEEFLFQNNTIFHCNKNQNVVFPNDENFEGETVGKVAFTLHAPNINSKLMMAMYKTEDINIPVCTHSTYEDILNLDEVSTKGKPCILKKMLNKKKTQLNKPILTIQIASQKNNFEYTQLFKVVLDEKATLLMIQKTDLAEKHTQLTVIPLDRKGFISLFDKDPNETLNSDNEEVILMPTIKNKDEYPLAILLAFEGCIEGAAISGHLNHTHKVA